ncbi:hypothetical protein [Lactobacillus equicursoris]
MGLEVQQFFKINIMFLLIYISLTLLEATLTQGCLFYHVVDDLNNLFSFWQVAYIVQTLI